MERETAHKRPASSNGLTSDNCPRSPETLEL